MAASKRTAVIIGASSGIGEALARELNRAGWRVGLLARRLDRLESLRTALSPDTVVRRLDVAQAEAAATLERFLDELGGVDLVIISAGTGHNNFDLLWELDAETVTVNVLGFMAMANVAMHHFLRRGRGHVVGITSIAALRGNAAAAYAASKAFQSVYLDGLRDLARQSGHAIVVTEVQPGGVETAMLKPPRPLPGIVRWLFVASPEKAARQIFRAVASETKEARVHHEALRAGGVHSQAAAATGLGRAGPPDDPVTFLYVIRPARPRSGRPGPRDGPVRPRPTGR